LPPGYLDADGAVVSREAPHFTFGMVRQRRLADPVGNGDLGLGPGTAYA